MAGNLGEFSQDIVVLPHLQPLSGEPEQVVVENRKVKPPAVKCDHRPLKIPEEAQQDTKLLGCAPVELMLALPKDPGYQQLETFRDPVEVLGRGLNVQNAELSDV